MRITAVRLRQIEGLLDDPDLVLLEERHVRPLDYYPENRIAGPTRPTLTEDGKYPVRAILCQIETDEGVSGLSAPIELEQAFIIARRFAPLLLGEDPLATERIWDRLYRSSVHGRGGHTVIAIGAVDCALWDLKGRWTGLPVYRLLGGPTRTEIPAYASALGYSLEPRRAVERARSLMAEGYRGTKWFFRYGPGDGESGQALNTELAHSLREALGPKVDLMFDAWMGWDVPYTLAIADRLADLRPRWLEEPLMPDRIDALSALRAKVPFPIATGEHEFTRWGLKRLMDAGAADVLQPDVYWIGGISEAMKACALASTYDLPVIPHGHSVPATIQVLAAQPESICPWLEYLVKWNEEHQFFYRHPIRPVGGVVKLPTAPGLGVDIDESKIAVERDLVW